MVEPVDFSRPLTIVEFGPGTGTITSCIAEQLKPRSRYVGIETNKKFVEDMSIRFPHLRFFNCSAVEIESILKSLNIFSVDAILSGIPWASLPAGLQPEILDGAVRSLNPGGVFVTFAYVSGLLLPAAQNLRHQLKARFSSVETSRVIWNNFPPAFTYVCHR
jgi:phospholipid N-methyltransferase